VAAVFAAMLGLLDLMLAAFAPGTRFATVATSTGAFVGLALVFVASFVTGLVTSTMPWPKPPRGAPDRSGRHVSEGGG
jgi:hypothetical protein